MRKPHDILIHHALTTLPDSISGRKTLLEAVFAITVPKHPVRRRVQEMLVALEQHEAAQDLLPLNWENAKPSTSKPAHDGDGNGHHDGH